MAITYLMTQPKSTSLKKQQDESSISWMYREARGRRLLDHLCKPGISLHGTRVKSLKGEH